VSTESCSAITTLGSASGTRHWMSAQHQGPFCVACKFQSGGGSASCVSSAGKSSTSADVLRDAREGKHRSASVFPTVSDQSYRSVGAVFTEAP
jgi:hypothetical protein